MHLSTVLGRGLLDVILRGPETERKRFLLSDLALDAMVYIASRPTKVVL